jgi:hypothetical protein
MTMVAKHRDQFKGASCFGSRLTAAAQIYQQSAA